MSVRQFLIVLVLAGSAQAATFAWRFQDLVYLARPVAVLAHESAERFAPHAEHALTRETLTRAKLETLAQTAAARGDADLAIRALDRVTREYPSEAEGHLRLAHALRELGRMDEAAAAYRRAIATAVPETR